MEKHDNSYLYNQLHGKSRQQWLTTPRHQFWRWPKPQDSVAVDCQHWRRCIWKWGNIPKMTILIGKMMIPRYPIGFQWYGGNYSIFRRPHVHPDHPCHHFFVQFKKVPGLFSWLVLEPPRGDLKVDFMHQFPHDSSSPSSSSSSSSSHLLVFSGWKGVCLKKGD